MQTIKEEIAKNIAFYRKKSGLTQKQFAEKLGVKNTAVCNWENGNNSIDIANLVKASKVLNVSTNILMGATVEIFDRSGKPYEEIQLEAYLAPDYDDYKDLISPQDQKERNTVFSAKIIDTLLSSASKEEIQVIEKCDLFHVPISFSGLTEEEQHIACSILIRGSRLTVDL